jgi:hypothetical protein
MDGESDAITVTPSLSAPHATVVVRTPPLRPMRSETEPDDILPSIPLCINMLNSQYSPTAPQKDG